MNDNTQNQTQTGVGVNPPVMGTTDPLAAQTIDPLASVNPVSAPVTATGPVVETQLPTVGPAPVETPMEQSVTAVDAPAEMPVVAETPVTETPTV